MQNRRTRGRPRKSEITKLKVMAWFNVVTQVSGKSAAELEREFAADGRIKVEDGKEIRPCLWDKYRRGEVEPRMHPSKGRSISLVQAVEEKYPGTAKWLTLPLWRLLDFSHPVTMDELREVFKSMPPEIRDLIIKNNVLEGEIFWRARTDESILTQHIQKYDALIEFTMAAALVREAILWQQEALYKERVKHLLQRLQINNQEGSCIQNVNNVLAAIMSKRLDIA